MILRRTILALAFLVSCAGCAPSEEALPLGDPQADTPAATAAAFSFREADGRLTLFDGEQPVFAYNYEMQLPEDVSPEYRRSTYIHPLWDPSGEVLTDDFPEDHYHHRGLSWMWPAVLVGEDAYDLWHIEGIRQVFGEWLAREAGPEGATLGVRNVWRLAEQEVMHEEVWIRAYEAEAAGRALDVQLTFTALEPIELSGQENENKGYGGLVLRYAPREQTTITTAEGRQTEDSDHLHTPWADESGRFGGSEAMSGAAIFQHSENPDYPAAWTLRHYGFVGVAWPGTGSFRLEPGQPVTLRYRVWVHRGDAEAGRVAEAYEAFQQAPTPPLGS